MIRLFRNIALTFQDRSRSRGKIKEKYVFQGRLSSRSALQVLDRFEGGQAKRNGYLVFRRSSLKTSFHSLPLVAHARQLSSVSSNPFFSSSSSTFLSFRVPLECLRLFRFSKTSEYLLQLLKTRGTVLNQRSLYLNRKA